MRKHQYLRYRRWIKIIKLILEIVMALLEAISK